MPGAKYIRHLRNDAYVRCFATWQIGAILLAYIDSGITRGTGVSVWVVEGTVIKHWEAGWS